MASILTTGNSQVVKELCDALGLKHVKSLDIHFALDEMMIVKAEFCPEVDEVKQFSAILKKFELVEIIEKKEVKESI